MIKITKGALYALREMGINPIAVVDRPGCYKTIGIELPSKFEIYAGAVDCPGAIALVSEDTMVLKEWSNHTVIDIFNPRTDRVCHVDALGSLHYFSVEV